MSNDEYVEIKEPTEVSKQELKEANQQRVGKAPLQERIASGINKLSGNTPERQAQAKAYKEEYAKNRIEYMKQKAAQDAYREPQSPIQKIQGFSERLGNFGTNLSKARGTQRVRSNQRMSNRQTVKIRGQKYILMPAQPNQPYQPPQHEAGMTSTAYQKDRFASLMEIKPMDFHGSNTRDFGSLLSLQGMKSPIRKKKGNSLDSMFGL